MGKPFEGIRVLDATHVLAGPFCTWQFALLGADVIKVESPKLPDRSRGRGPDDGLNRAGLGLTYQAQGTNKRALALDLANPEGRAVFLRLVETADVLVENRRPGVFEALGLGYDLLKTVRPELVYCAITGYGAEGPRGGLGAYDNTIQAAAGVIDQSGGHKPGLSFADYAAGYGAAFAVAAALLRRMREGRGVRIEHSMFETALLCMAPELAAALHEEARPRPREAGLGVFETADGRRLMLGAFTPEQNARLWRALEGLGHPETDGFAAFAEWPDLWAAADRMRLRLAEIFRTRGADDWAAWLREAGVPGEPVRSLAEAARDPQLEARGFLTRPADGGPLLPSSASRFSEDGPELAAPAPALGAHTREILAEIGVENAEIDRLFALGVAA